MKTEQRTTTLPTMLIKTKKEYLRFTTFIIGLRSLEYQSPLIYKPISAISAPSLLRIDLRKKT